MSKTPRPPHARGLTPLEKTELARLLARVDALRGLADTPQEREAKRKADALAVRERKVAAQLASLQAELDEAQSTLNELVSDRVLSGANERQFVNRMANFFKARLPDDGFDANGERIDLGPGGFFVEYRDQLARGRQQSQSSSGGSMRGATMALSPSRWRTKGAETWPSRSSAWAMFVAA